MRSSAGDPRRDNAPVPAATENHDAKPLAAPVPRRGRAWVILLLALGVGALAYALVNIATQKAGPAAIRIAGIGEAQELFGGIPQEADRIGSSDADCNSISCEWTWRMPHFRSPSVRGRFRLCSKP